MMTDVDPISEAAKSLTHRFADFMGATVGELIKDEVHLLRWKNAHRVLDKADSYLIERNAKGKKTLPLGMAIRFLDGASLEEDPLLQDMWARLLANAADPENDYEMTKTHTSILSEMNGLDARLLESYLGQGWLQFRQVAINTRNAPLDCDELSRQLGESEEDVALALGNLWRLGCLIQEPTYESGIGPSVSKNSTFHPSALGYSLLEAVSLKKSK